LAQTNPFRHKKGSKNPLSEVKPGDEKGKNRGDLKRRRYRNR
jgi:hypothetical protein